MTWDKKGEDCIHISSENNNFFRSSYDAADFCLCVCLVCVLLLRMRLSSLLLLLLHNKMKMRSFCIPDPLIQCSFLLLPMYDLF